jgi:6-phosphogluconolactonase
MALEIAKNMDELSSLAADRIAAYIRHRLDHQDIFTIALSGGTTPKNIYRLLEVNKDKIDWPRIHIFWGDERMVPFNDERNNAKMAFETLIMRVSVPESQVHIMRTDIEPQASAGAYNLLLHQYFIGKEKSFDLVLLGLGEDAHTLSLFPGEDTLHEKNKWAVPVYLQKQDMYRITLTPPIVNNAACIFFIVGGEGKSQALKNVLEGPFEPDRYPAQIIRPLNGELVWLVDIAAAARLEKNQ